MNNITCVGSGARVGISVGQQNYTGGAVRPNIATDVRCPDCARAFKRARIVYTDHGIKLTHGVAVIPRHAA